ncbi:MAG: circadian clock protein KaiC [Chloroflexota bacterium]
MDLVPTGVSGLDELLGGGLVAGTMALVEGAPGTGKTTLGLQFIHHGVVVRGEPGLVLTFEEVPQQLYADAQNFGWDLRRLVAEGKLHVICLTPEVLQRQLGDPEQMWGRLARGAAPRRVLIDSITHLRQLTADEVRLREILNVFLSGMRRQGLTALLLTEMEERGGESIPFEEYAVDAVLRLTYNPLPGQAGPRQRSLEILKTRGQDHVAGRHSFKFGAGGLQVFPHPRPRPITAPRDDRHAFLGIAGFDGLLDRGIPASAHVMLVGDTGVGKTLSSLLFLYEGLQCAEWCAFVDCDEVPAMTRRTLAHFGMPTTAHERIGRLRFVDAYGREGTSEPLAVRDPTNLDEVLHMEDLVLTTLREQGDAVRLCVDGMSTILATCTYNAAIDFVAAHLHNLRARQVFSLDTYTSGTLEPRLMANITQHYDLVISMRFGEVHGAPIRLGAIDKYRFGKVAREEQIFSIDPRVGIVSHKAALQG